MNCGDRFLSGNFAPVANFASPIPENLTNETRVRCNPSIRESLFCFTEFGQLC
jgi:hypothetical protein